MEYQYDRTLKRVRTLYEWVHGVISENSGHKEQYSTGLRHCAVMTSIEQFKSKLLLENVWIL